MSFQNIEDKAKVEVPEWSLFNEEGQSFLSSQSSQVGLKGIVKTNNYQLILVDIQVTLTFQTVTAKKRLGISKHNTYISSCLYNFGTQCSTTMCLQIISISEGLNFPTISRIAFLGKLLVHSQIGVAVLSFLGVMIDYCIFSVNQRRSIQHGCYSQQTIYYSFPATILLCGLLSHFFFFAFALLPADQKLKTPPSALYAEDRIFLTLSLVLNFVFKGYYVFFNSRVRNPIQSLSLPYQVKTALFTVICFLFSACKGQTLKEIIIVICVNAVSLCLGMPIFQDGEPQLTDESSAAEDFIALMVGEIYSTLAYSLYIVNGLFVGMYYYDLRLITIMMTIQESNEKRKHHIPIF